MSYQLNTKDINRLAIPAILFSITEPLIGLTDMAIIGSIPEHATEAQGGVGLAAGLISTLLWGLAQVRTAVSAIVSKYLGMDKLTEVRSLVPQALAFVLMLGVVAWLLTDSFYPEISGFLFSDDNALTRQFSFDYYHIRSIGLPLSLFIAGVFGVFRGYQNTSWAMVISLIGGGLNILLDLLMVNGVGELIPAMGVEGAAWASVISQLVMAILCVHFMITKTPFPIKLSFNLNPEFLNMLKITWNMFIRTLALNIAFILGLRFASGYGDAQLTAYSIGINIWLFSSYFIDGYSNAGNAIAGKLLGKKDNQQLRWLGWKLMKINVRIAIALGIVYTLSYPVMGAFFNEDPEVQRVFNTFFWMVILSQPINSIAYSFDGIFKGLGEAAFLRNVLLIGTFLIFTPVVYIMDSVGLGIHSVWIAFMAWMLWRASSLVVRFNHLTKQKIE